ncbi:MAG: response regulator [Desulfamplus sp.]|nr:response regulator [Desulfamplus sp.]MBF0209733.1 response regulator [Desulfamplus sp.]MBF0242924.1 response regulator [Desulfamplus sp.]
MIDKTILVVDDEESICLLLKSALSTKGYSVFTAETPSEALDILEKHTVLVMFIDLNLPEMTGVELCREIIKRNPLTIAYAITGYASHFELAECKSAGFEDYFKKPVRLLDIFNAAEAAFLKLERWKKN